MLKTQISTVVRSGIQVILDERVEEIFHVDDDSKGGR